MNANHIVATFVGGETGPWRVEQMKTLCGAPLTDVQRLQVDVGGQTQSAGIWSLQGQTGDHSYTTPTEAAALSAIQPSLGRPEATMAALIPIRKSPDWWALSTPERRVIYEDISRHTSIGLDYLPRVARRLHHCRDAGAPFDFLTWFEFAPEHIASFEHMLVRLRATEEWRYVAREVDIRLKRSET